MLRVGVHGIAIGDDDDLVVHPHGVARRRFAADDWAPPMPQCFSRAAPRMPSNSRCAASGAEAFGKRRLHESPYSGDERIETELGVIFSALPEDGLDQAAFGRVMSSGLARHRAHGPHPIAGFGDRETSL